MSYYKYFKNYPKFNGIQYPDIANIDHGLESNISNKFISTLKSIYKFVVNLLKKIYTWIKTKLLKIIEFFSKNNKDLIAIKEVVSTLDNDKFNKLLKDTLSKTKNLETSLEGYDNNDYDIQNLIGKRSISKDEMNRLLIFLASYKCNYVDSLFTVNNGRTQLIDFEQILEEAKQYVDDVLKYNNKIIYIDEIWNRLSNYYFVNTFFNLPNHKSIHQSSWKITATDFFKGVNNLNEITKKAKQYSDYIYNSLSKECKVLEKDIAGMVRTGDNIDYDDATIQLSTLRSAINIASLPYVLCVQYLRFIIKLKTTLNENDYLTTTLPPNINLLHVSFDPHLDKYGYLDPSLRYTGKMEFLPKRTSFATSVEQCCAGIDGRIKNELDKLANGLPSKVSTINNREYYFDIYVYKGITDKETRCIAREFMDLYLSDNTEINEIAITTRINIKLFGKYRVYIDLAYSRSVDKYRRYIRIE